MTTLVRILDRLILIVFFIIMILIVTGGFRVEIGGMVVSAHDTENAAIGLAVLLAIRTGLWLPRRDPPILLVDRLQRWVETASRLPRSRLRAVPYASAIAYAVLMSAVTMMKHRAYQSHAFDLGIFDQILWNTVHGKILHSSILDDRHFFGEHVSPILLLLVPLYKMVPAPETILCLQSLALASGAIPLYWIARKFLADEVLATIFPLSYLAYQPMRNVNLFDFHPIALATPLLLWAFWHLVNKQYVRFALFLLVAMACKEEVALIAVALGLYVIIAHRRQVVGGSIVAFGILVFALEIFVVIPFYRQAAFAFVARYGYLGSSIPEIVKTLLTRPLYVLQHVVTLPKIEYVVRVFGPVGFLSFLDWHHLLLAVPTLAQNLLSDADGQYSILFQYTAPLTPFVFISAVFGARRALRRWGPAAGNSLAVILILAAVLFFGESPISRLREFQVTEHHRTLDRIANAIPADASASAQDTLVPHVSRRFRVYQFPVVSDVDYILLDTTANTYPLERREYRERVRAVLDGGDYGVEFHEGPVLLLKRGHSSAGNADAVDFLMGADTR